MLHTFTIETAHKYGDIIPQMYKFRHQVFVEGQGYEVCTHNGMEWDQFDTPLANYIVVKDEGGNIAGSIRLIPTTAPYMIGEVWSHLMKDSELPRDQEIWETSRFGVDRNLPPDESRKVVGKLMAGVIEFGLLNGVRYFMTMTAPAIFRRSMQKTGARTKLLCEPQRLGNFPVIVGRWEVSGDTLEKIRKAYGIEDTLLGWKDDV